MPSGSVTFNANETSKVLTINVAGDTTGELDDGFTVTLASPANATIGTATAVGTILNDDAVLNTATIAPTKDNTLIQDASGSLSNGGGDIFVGQNSNGNLIRRGLLAFDVAGNIPAGATIQSVTLTMYVSQAPGGDHAVELHKVLADWGEAGSIANGSGGPAQSGDATWLHQFYDSQPWSVPGGDFSPVASGVQTVGSQGISYTWDSTTQMVDDVQAWLDDPSTNFGWLLQADESQNSAKRFASRESSDPALRPRLTVAYLDAVPPEISIGDVVIAEGDTGTTSAQFQVTLSAPSKSVVTVDYATADGTATAGSDYLAASGTVTFAPNETTQTVTVTVNGDAQVESGEDFLVNLSNPGNATVADRQGVGTITNDDTAGLAAISISDVKLAEGSDGTTEFIFSVTLNSAAAGPVSVDFATADGTARAARVTAGDDDDDHDDDHDNGDRAGPDDRGDDDGDDDRASASADYTAHSGTLYFTGKAGETQTITVSVRGDTELEPDEVFYVNLSNAVGASIADPQGVGTILNTVVTDVAVHMKVSERVASGKTLIYRIQVSNEGPMDAPGTQVKDVFPVGLSQVKWTAVASGGAAGALRGTGDILETIDLPVNGKMIYTVTGVVSAKVGTELKNTVTVSTAAGITDRQDDNDSRTRATKVVAKPWQNSRDREDVDDRDGATPLDVLSIINRLNAFRGGSKLEDTPEEGAPYFDVSGDGNCTALDALMVINRINGQPRVGGEGEAIIDVPGEPSPALAANAAALDVGQQDVGQPAASAASSAATREVLWGELEEASEPLAWRDGHRLAEPSWSLGMEAVLSDIGQDIATAWLPSNS